MERHSCRTSLKLIIFGAFSIICCGQSIIWSGYSNICSRNFMLGASFIYDDEIIRMLSLFTVANVNKYRRIFASVKARTLRKSVDKPMPFLPFFLEKGLGHSAWNFKSQPPEKKKEKKNNQTIIRRNLYLANRTVKLLFIYLFIYLLQWTFVLNT